MCIDWSSEDMEDLSDSVSSDPVHDIVDLISSLDDYHGVLTQLLQEKNLEGYTPFMAAVVYKVLMHMHTRTSTDSHKANSRIALSYHEIMTSIIIT